ncbi:hypothetical protein PROFUN_04093 [Planoprotostelium fungivorum]|uniref:Uncharacterized protein n=1 Tax=Planoprotostelium fungivorum TaxID=1890364 RepID=A0A2P6NJJ1_9EUKA|nr:hypothetical protein PROFUN_04093 [Planoprotostelium fungivorum]
MFTYFGFEKEGHAHLDFGKSLNADSRVNWLIVCDQASYHLEILNATHYTTDIDIKEDSTYFFLVANCGLLPFNYHISGRFQNRGGEHLSTQYVPLPTFYSSISPVWFLIVLAFTFNWLQHRKQSVALHKLMWSLPLAKGLFCVYNAYYWRVFSRYGRLETWQTITYHVSYVIVQLLMYSVLFLVSKGWGVTRSNLSTSEKKSLVVCVTALSAASTLYQINGGYFLFALVIMYVIAMKYVFSGLEHNLRSLSRQRQFLVQRQHARSHTHN